MIIDKRIFGTIDVTRRFVSNYLLWTIGIPVQFYFFRTCKHKKIFLNIRNESLVLILLDQRGTK